VALEDWCRLKIRAKAPSDRKIKIKGHSINGSLARNAVNHSSGCLSSLLTRSQNAIEADFYYVRCVLLAWIQKAALFFNGPQQHEGQGAFIIL
jgi:hypothetical protein